MSRMQAVARLATLLILWTMLASALSACGDRAVKFKSSDITGVTFSGHFNLPRVDVDEDCRTYPLCDPPVKTTCLIAQLERG